MKRKNIIKKIMCSVTTVMAVMIFGLNAFSLLDFGAGESDLINNESTPYKVNIIADNQIVSIVPMGIGLRGDADESGAVSLQDAVEISRSVMNIADENYKNTLGYAMADTNNDGKVSLMDVVNVATYIIRQGTPEERWQNVLGN